MAQLIFKRGSLANLNNLAIKDGQFIVTTDEGALYVDNGSTRVRLGDFIVVENVAALPASGANRKAMYYCESENVLARWNGTDWTQINKQPTTAELKVRLGLDADGEVTAAIKAAKKAGDDAQTAVDDLTTYVGTIPNGEDGQPMAASVVAYINKKTDGIATSGNLEALGNRVSTVEGKVATIEGDYLKKADKEALAGDISKAQTAADNAQTHSEGVAKDLGEHEADAVAHITAAEREAWNGKTTMADVEAKKYLVAADIEGKADKTQVATDIAAAVKTETDNREAAEKAINDKIGAVTEGKTVVEMIAAAQTAATYDDTQVKADIKTNADNIKAISDDYLKAADKEALQGSIDAVSGKVTTLIGEDANKSVRTIANEELAAQLIAEGAKESLDTLQEIAAWIQSHPDDASAMNDAIQALEAIVDGIGGEGESATVVAYVTSAIEALKIGDYATVTALNGALERIGVLEGASATHALKTEVEGVSTALNEYKEAHKDDYTNAQVDAAIKVVADDLKAYEEAHDSDYTNEQINNAINNAVANAGHASANDLATHTGNTDIHVTTADKEKWNGAEQNAKDYSDGKLATARTEISAEIDADVKAEADRAKGVESGLQTAINTINNAENGILAQAKADATSKSNAAQSAAEKTASDALTAALTWGEF